MPRGVIVLIAAATLAACESSPRAGTEPGLDACALGATGAPWLVYASTRSGNSDLYLARADATCTRQLTFDPADDFSPSFGKGGRIAFASTRGFHSGIWIHDLGTAAEWVVDVGTLALATAPAFSPDGSRIAFEGRRAGASGSDLFVVSAAGGDPVQLTTSAANDSGPVWSPEGGSTIYFVAARDAFYDVYAVPAAGGPDVRVTNRSGILGKPALSPDGGALYYARSSAGTYQVVRRSLATGEITAVTSQSDTEPVVSPAGDLLAVRSLRDGFANVYVMNALDGSVAVPITSDAADDGSPSFAPAP